jgi:hypothetical protein
MKCEPIECSFLSSLMTLLQRYICHLSGRSNSVKVFPLFMLRGTVTKIRTPSFSATCHGPLCEDDLYGNQIKPLLLKIVNFPKQSAFYLFQFTYQPSTGRTGSKSECLSVVCEFSHRRLQEIHAVGQ